MSTLAKYPFQTYNNCFALVLKTPNQLEQNLLPNIWHDMATFQNEFGKPTHIISKMDTRNITSEAT